MKLKESIKNLWKNYKLGIILGGIIGIMVGSITKTVVFYTGGIDFPPKWFIMTYSLGYYIGSFWISFLPHVSEEILSNLIFLTTVMLFLILGILIQFIIKKIRGK